MADKTSCSSTRSHFILPEERGTGTYKCKCKHCGVLITTVDTTTSNLMRHLQRKHSDKLVKAQPKLATVCKQPTIGACVTQRAKYKQNDPKQQRFLRNLPMFVASSLQSFSVVDDEEFRNMIMDLDSRIVCPSRKHLSTKLIPDKALEMQKSLISQLSDCTEISMTIDIWTNRQMRSYIGITAHFIREWKLQNAMLVCKRFTGRHTADNIVAQYEEVINAFHIRGKITNIVTDNASNMIKAFRLPGFVVDECDPESDSDDDDSEVDIDNNVFMYLPSHDSCYAHTVQLVVKDGLKEADTIKAVIAKASSIVGCEGRSTISTEMLEECRKLQASNTTRWNSELTMIQSLLRIPHEKNDELNLAHKLSQYERIILTELCDLLTPFGTATDYTQGDKVVTASLVIPSIRGLKAQLLNVSVQYTEPVRAALLKSIDRRLSAYEDKNSFQMAAILDPRFKLAWCHSKQESAKMKNGLMTAVDVLTLLQLYLHHLQNHHLANATSCSHLWLQRLHKLLYQLT